jgi:hypothetical protein
VAFPSGAVAPGVCVKLSIAIGCTTLTDAQGAWRSVVATSLVPTFVYLYQGVEKGRQTPTADQRVGGGTVSLGRYVLAP